MSTPPTSRSVKISDDERTGWSSDRPRRDGGPNRPIDISVRCRVLTPSGRQRYSPGSLLVIVCASKIERDRFTDRLIEDKASLLSLDKVRGLLAGRVEPAELEARAAQILDSAVAKRLGAGETVVIAADGIDVVEREHIVRMAHGLKRPRHMIFLEVARDNVEEDDRGTLNDLRSALDAGDLGAEGFQTAMRLGGSTITELKRIVFSFPPRED